MSRTERTLEKLTIDELKWLVSQFVHDEGIICEILVDESKGHLTSRTAIEKIRENLRALQYLGATPESTAIEIQYRMGKLSIHEVRQLLGLE